MQFEADRRAFNITINSFGTELTRDVRIKLYPTCGKLFPEGLAKLAECSDYAEVQRVAEYYPVCTMLRRVVVVHTVQVYRNLFDGVGNGAGDKTLEDKFYEHEVCGPLYDDDLITEACAVQVKLKVDGFMQQFHYGLFYSYMKLKEQESRNIVWISECIAQKHKAKIDNYINIF